MDGDSEDEKLATSTRAASGVLNEGVRMVSAALFLYLYIRMYPYLYGHGVGESRWAVGPSIFETCALHFLQIGCVVGGWVEGDIMIMVRSI